MVVDNKHTCGVDQTSEKVETFLKRFHAAKDVDEVFVSGCCYWFAAVLFGRFIRDGAAIMYDRAENHFGTKVHGRVYDITGDVTDKYDWITWDSISDPEHRARITRDCILF